MLNSLSPHDRRQRSAADDLTRRWMGTIGLTAASGSVYFLAGLLGIRLLMPAESIAVFWPAAGISSGILLAFGPGARWPVVAGAMAATICVNLLSRVDAWTICAFVLGNTAEPLIVAGLIAHYFGTRFSLDQLRSVLGLFAAAVAGPTVAGIGWTVVYRLLHASTVPILNTWQHWFASDVTGIITVAPLVIGLAAAARQQPPRRELIEGIAAIAALAMMTGIIISLPRQPWETVMPVTWLFPILLWLAARCRPIFSAAGAFIVSLTVVSTTIFGIGYFGDADLPIGERTLQAQAVILVVAIFALVIAALFAERTTNEARLNRLNMLLGRERENKLMNVQAIIAAISHEIRQPLGAITTNASAAQRWLKRTPPDHDEVRAALDRIKVESHRTSEVFDGISALFGKVDQERQQVDMNDIILSVIHSLEGQFNDHGVAVHRELAAELPLIAGHSGQLREVIFNLVNNALEAMRSTTNRSRVLHVRTELRDRDAIAVAIQDTGPGIDPNKLAGIFGAFVTTKTHGTGLGLAICLMIVERHGGQLTASSDGKGGALFQFILPIESADKAENSH
jgi:signal transduction histidine kinase